LALFIDEKSGLSSKLTNSDKQPIVELERKLSGSKSEIFALNEQLSKAISLQAKEFIKYIYITSCMPALCRYNSFMDSALVPLNSNLNF
jgi:hypothetical protein